MLKVQLIIKKTSWHTIRKNENSTTSFKRTSLSSSGAKQPTTSKAEGRLSKTQENKRDNKHSIRKQHADNQSEEDESFRGGKSEKEE